VWVHCCRGSWFWFSATRSPAQCRRSPLLTTPGGLFIPALPARDSPPRLCSPSPMLPWTRRRAPLLTVPLSPRAPTSVSHPPSPNTNTRPPAPPARAARTPVALGAPCPRQRHPQPFPPSSWPCAARIYAPPPLLHSAPPKAPHPIPRRGDGDIGELPLCFAGSADPAPPCRAPPRDCLTKNSAGYGPGDTAWRSAAPSLGGGPRTCFPRGEGVRGGAVGRGPRRARRRRARETGKGDGEGGGAGRGERGGCAHVGRTRGPETGSWQGGWGRREAAPEDTK
jgi:hypothetical protein